MGSFVSLFTIVAILGSLVSTVWSTPGVKARDARRVTGITQLRTALELYRAESGLGDFAYPWNGGVVLGGVQTATLSRSGFTDREHAKEPLYMSEVPHDPDADSRHISRRTYRYWSIGDDYVIEFEMEGNGTQTFPKGKNYVSADSMGQSTDTDEDGLPDAVEKMFGTDNTAKDTDGDGYDDATELRNEFNPGGMGKIWMSARSDKEIIAVVRGLPDVQKWLKLFPGQNQTAPKTGGRATIEIDTADLETANVHVYEILRDHTATFGWYEVKKRTGVAKRIVP